MVSDMHPLLIIDSDHLTYRSAASCEPTKTRLDRVELHIAIARMEWSINNIFEKTGSDKYEMYIGGQDNFRKTLYPAYKANRDKSVKPMWLEDCREHLMVKWGAKIVNGMEVDDMCGIRLTALNKKSWTNSVISGDFLSETRPICVSLDKDLLQIPGRHYNFVNDEHVVVSDLEGLRRFYKQIILGDLSDNVPGYDGKYRDKVPKFIKAMQDPLDELADEVEMYEHVCNVYGGDVERVDLHAQLLYVLRKEEEYWQNPLKRSELKSLPQPGQRPENTASLSHSFVPDQGAGHPSTNA